MEKFNFRTIKNISATCFALEPYITKILGQQSIKSCLAREHVEGLSAVSDMREGYQCGKKIREKVPLLTTKRLEPTSKGTGILL